MRELEEFSLFDMALMRPEVSDAGPAAVTPAEKPSIRKREKNRRVFYTDGACMGNPGPGGWAWVEPATGLFGADGAAETTNNIMELTAILDLLSHVGNECNLLIFCDSQYVINALTKWVFDWQRRGWRTASGKPVANLELIQKISRLLQSWKGDIEWQWVKGHVGVEGNERADSLASQQARRYSEQ